MRLPRSKTRGRYWRSTRPTTNAFDTETCRGRLKVICSPTRAFEPDGHAECLLEFLVEEGAEVNWLWNLAFDSDVVLRVLFEAVDIEHDEAARERFLDEHAVQVGEYRVTLIGHKCFSVERGKIARRFYDAAAFYTLNEVRQKLDDVALQVLGVGKTDQERGLSREALGTEEGYYEAHREAVVAYCHDDAALTLRLGDRLLDVAREALGFYPSRWASAASLAKAWLEYHYPDLMKQPKAMLARFRHSYRGGLFVTRVLGRVKHVTEYDVTTAYGHALQNLPSLDGLEVRAGRAVSPDAVYGAYCVAVRYDGKTPWRLADMGARLKRAEDEELRLAGEVVLYPTSDTPAPYWATLDELRFWDEVGRPYEVLQSVELCGAPKGLQFPTLRDLGQRIADLKDEAKHSVEAFLRREMLKRVQNSIYGALAESRHGETPFTTWPLAAAVTARVRVSIWREWMLVEKGGGVVVSVNTDSLRAVPNRYAPPVEKRVGGFEVKFADATVTHYQSGIALVEHSPSCACGGCGSWPRLLREDDGLGRGRRKRAPDRPDAVEIHAPECPCERCGRAPRAGLRKRGLPKLTVAALVTARGSTLDTVTLRPIHATEAMRLRALPSSGKKGHRLDDIADIPSSEDDVAEDDGARRRTLDLNANRVRHAYAAGALTFETLNRGPVLGASYPFERLLDRPWVRRALEGDPPTESPNARVREKRRRVLIGRAP